MYSRAIHNVGMDGLIVGLVILAAAALLLRPRADFTIRVRGGDVRISGRLPERKRREVMDFFGKQFCHRSRLTVVGHRQPRARTRLSIRGVADAGEEQMIRNFLAQTL